MDLKLSAFQSVFSLLPKAWRKKIRDYYYRDSYKDIFAYGNHSLSFSQEGEDLILARYFNNKRQGFFVDVGAHHPVKFSNTRRFYNRGWRGINIDPLPGTAELFLEDRPGDISLEMGVSSRDGDRLTYYMFSEAVYNTCNEVQARGVETAGHARLLQTREVPTHRLATILEQYLPANTEIDFLSVDVEGMDLEVLQSNDWGRFRPRVVLCEAYGQSFEEVMNAPVTTLLATHGYSLLAKTINTVLYERKEPESPAT